MTNPATTPDDDAVDALLRRHFSSAATTFESPVQPAITSLLPTPRRWHRWRAPAAVAGGLIAAATATVLVISSTAPSSGPMVGVAPSGVTSPDDLSSTDVLPAVDTEPAARITVRGAEYELVGAVPWYTAMRISNTVAVTTGPEVRGACNTGIYRLMESSRGDDMVLTSYHYEPVRTAGPTACLGIGLPPYVAALEVGSAPHGSVLDGARPSDPAAKLNSVLIPESLPPGFTATGPNSDFPQLPDPDRPAFPAFTEYERGGVVQSYSSGDGWLRVTQGSASSVQGPVAQGKTTVGPHPATILAPAGSAERCVRWTDDAAGKVEVCGMLDGGTDAVIAVARSIYPSSAAPEGAGEGQIMVGGAAYRRIGTVPWLRATAHGNQVSVAISALNGTNCQEAHDLFRVDAERSGGVLALTVTRYIPVEQQKPDCSLILRPLFVAAVDLGSPVTEEFAVDGSRQVGSTGRAPKPLVRVLLPSFVPDGFTLGGGTGSRLLLQDPDRPEPIGVLGPYDAPEDSAATRYGSTNTGLAVTQGIALHDSGKFEQRTTIRGRAAVVVLDTGQRCVRWQEPDIGPVQVCSGPIRTGGRPLPIDVMIQIAESMAP